MIVIPGLILLIAAVVVGVAGVLANTGSAHALRPTAWRSSATTVARSRAANMCITPS